MTGTRAPTSIIASTRILCSNFQKKNKNKKLKEKGKERRKGKAVDLIISRLLAYIKFTQRRGRRGDRSIFRKAASIDKQIIGRDVIFRDGV